MRCFFNIDFLLFINVETHEHLGAYVYRIMTPSNTDWMPDYQKAMGLVASVNGEYATSTAYRAITASLEITAKACPDDLYEATLARLSYVGHILQPLFDMACDGGWDIAPNIGLKCLWCYCKGSQQRDAIAERLLTIASALIDRDQIEICATVLDGIVLALWGQGDVSIRQKASNEYDRLLRLTGVREKTSAWTLQRDTCCNFNNNDLSL